MDLLGKKTKSFPLTLFATILQPEGKDVFVQLRCRTSERQLVKQLLSVAYRGEQATFFVSFRNKPIAINSLLQHGVIVRESDGKGGDSFKFIE